MSLPRVLVVDEDRQFVDALRRSLGLDYDLSVAETGPQALDMISNSESIPVIVAGMPMVGMDGVQFLAQARLSVPDASLVLLTGYYDFGTAVRAVNEAGVFRLLAKPCEVSTVANAIQAGFRQFELVQSEKALLARTCASSVGMLMAVLEANQPDVSPRLASFRKVFDQLCGLVGLRPSWELSLASRLALIGLVCFDPTESKAFLATPPAEAAWRRVFERIARTSIDLFARVPRMESVCRMIEAMPTTDGSCFKPNATDANDVVSMGATLLHIAAMLDAGMSQGLARRQAIAEVRLGLRHPRPEYLDVLERMAEPSLPNPGIEVDPADLRVGMVLYSDFKASDGYILFRAGKRVTEIVIERIRERFASGEPLQPVQVVNDDAAIAETV